MYFWLISLLFLAIAILCVLVPLRSGKRYSDDETQDDPLEIYRAQLAAIENKAPSNEQQKRALEEERAEIARRLLRYSRQNDQSATTASKRGPVVAASVVALFVLPAIAITTYLSIGSPHLSDQPLSARLNNNLAEKSVDELILIAKRHLKANPDDPRGWKTLADTYAALNRPADRAVALRQLIRLTGATPELQTELGEALTVSKGNIVPEEARKLFEGALAQKPDLAKASLYFALAQEQEGKFDAAYKRWLDLAAIRKTDQRWQAMAQARLTALRKQLGIAEPTGPSAEDIKDAASLSLEDRTAMIESMVGGLAERLKDEPNDPEGWLRLIRSYAVLKKDVQATGAYIKAKEIFAGNQTVLQRLTQLSKQLNISEEAVSPSTTNGDEQ